MLELAGILILGIVAQWISWRMKLPAILPLILIGLLVGPISTLWTADGSKLIEPIYNLTTKRGLFPPGQNLYYFVSLAIGIILFEGGLTLKLKEVKEIGKAIINLITIGSVVTFVGAGLMTHYVMGLSWAISFLFAALIIVTGPTVIAPILRNTSLNRNVAAVLKWEGILIDPIGALVAVIVFDLILLQGEGQHVTEHTIKILGQIVIVGSALGFVSAYFMKLVITKKLVPHYLLNVFVLAFVLFLFGFSDVLAHESGLLAVVVMGMTMANIDVPNLKEILYFKESLSILLISILFILLSANIEIEHLQLLLDTRCLVLFLLVVLVLRPLGVFLSTINSGLSFKEKLFIGWVGPRGIVAAGIASLFGLKLVQLNIAGAEYLTPLVFMIVLGTVLLNATTARFMAKILGVTQGASNGILIVGANNASRMIGKYLQDSGRHVVLLDRSKEGVSKALQEGLDVIEGSIYDDDLSHDIELSDVGYLLAMTSNAGVNDFTCEKYTDEFGEMGTYRLLTADEIKSSDSSKLPAKGLFSSSSDYINLNEVARDYPNIHEIQLRSKEHFQKIMELLNNSRTAVPLFIKNKEGFLHVISLNLETLEFEPEDTLAYLGEALVLPTIDEKLVQEKEPKDN